MSELRQKFENVEEVKNSLSCHIYIGSDGLYYTSLVNFQKLVSWLNGAWYAFQEQQTKIDLLEKEIVETQEFLNKQNHIKQAKIDELKHQKSLQELAINQISQANQEWRSINYEQQKRIGALSKRLNEAISIVVDDLEEFMRGEK